MLLRAAGMMERYSANDKVVLECRDIVQIDAPMRQGKQYSSYCPNCRTWERIIRRAFTTEKIGGRFQGSTVQLWQTTEATKNDMDGTLNRESTPNDGNSESVPGF